ncbi:NADH-quinone oxidoreductase subunit C [Anaeromyxobacter sp. Fw109-5]|uniref:NADH-quinone oxidoreductase subunit C n=1 Tax=Anaeromyxobacter sp. (strain Fw109-5) TaxID=404589 RepID=UPI000158A791|nr:NADH-quinone oxidoreductase subunit C [Anaeromyxobacter sp. Fw109-5]ABS25500.1 NADH (or F420H2) dehydrogenase, subunit C [Anaeromyxobacter sp. Fw109-5]
MSKAVIDALVERFPDAVYDPYVGVGGDDCAFVKKDRIVDVCRFLKSDPGMLFDMAPYITAVDYLGQEPRFEVVYNLLSLKTNRRARLRVKVPEQDAVVPSVTGLWRGADWFERYCFDMYGIRFTGHPDMRRLLMYDEFVGHPLRKDYPLKGRQPLVQEREVRDIVRGPGPATRD